MRTRTIVIVLFVLLFVVLGITYVRMSLIKSASPPEPARTPSLADAPVRVYGRIEPLGREVFVGPVRAGRVIETLVKEGQDVSAGQPLCRMENNVERQALKVAKARVEELKVSLDLILDELKKKRPLLESGGISEIAISQKLLEAELLRKQIATAEAEAELKRRELRLFTLRSPIDGLLYKFDVRPGEYLTPQDANRIVIGKRRKQVRLFIESFWVGKVAVGDPFVVRDAEDYRVLGKGKVVYVANYVGTRDFRTEDPLERLDTKYVQAILQLEEAVDSPLGSLVLCERLDDQKKQ
ncbi:MAG: HlyD family efflux transporter periplasmic adaptor subunit [Nitrospirae bacterium]|nr:MAG: HlyD family efflux transporter periplasmic adaptor subunit [Nitrospirota bacterium]